MAIVVRDPNEFEANESEKDALSSGAEFLGEKDFEREETIFTDEDFEGLLEEDEEDEEDEDGEEFGEGVFDSSVSTGDLAEG